MPEAGAAAALCAAGGPALAAAARLARLEQRVDALAMHCDARLTELEARWQSLPTSAQYDPFAVPVAEREQGAGAAPEDRLRTQRSARAARHEPGRRREFVDPLGIGAQRAATTAAAVREGLDAGADVLARMGRAVGVALPSLGVLGTLVEQAMARLPDPKRAVVAAPRVAGGAAGAASQAASSTRLPAALADIVEAVSGTLRARSAAGLARGVADTATQVMRAAQQAGRAVPRPATSSFPGPGMSPFGSLPAGEPGLLQPVAASALLDALAALGGPAAQAKPKSGSTATQASASKAASAGAIEASSDGVAMAPRAVSKLLAPKGGSDAARRDANARAPAPAIPADDAAADPLAALNRLLIDQAWLRGVDLR